MKQINVIKEYFSTYQFKLFTLFILLLLGVIVGRFILSYDFITIIGITAGLCIAISAFLKPEIGILGIIIITSSIIFEDALPLMSIGIGSLHVTDLLLLYMLSIIFLKLFTDNKFKLVKTPLNLPLLLFYLTALVSFYVAIVNFDVNLNIAARQLRKITYYLIFFVIINLIRNKKQLVFLLNGLFVIASIVAITMIAQAIIGESIQLMPGRVDTLKTLDKEFGGSIRVLPPGEGLIYISFITLFCLIIISRTPNNLLFNLPKFALIGIGVILTYSRNFWASICLALFIFIFLLPKIRHKIRIIKITLLFGIALSILLLTFTIWGGRTAEFVTSTKDRITSLFAGDKLYRSGSLEARKIENYYAFEKIKKYPIAGIGLGNSYIYRERWEGDKGTYIHNGYLWILTQMGLLGFIAFIWLSIYFIVRGFKNWKYVNDPFLKGVSIGFTLSYLALMISNFVSPKFIEWSAIVIIGTLMAINEKIHTLFQEK